jgi:hypothetical protein
MTKNEHRLLNLHALLVALGADPLDLDQREQRLAETSGTFTGYANKATTLGELAQKQREDPARREREQLIVSIFGHAPLGAIPLTAEAEFVEGTVRMNAGGRTWALDVTADAVVAVTRSGRSVWRRGQMVETPSGNGQGGRSRLPETTRPPAAPEAASPTLKGCTPPEGGMHGQDRHRG